MGHSDRPVEGGDTGTSACPCGIDESCSEHPKSAMKELREWALPKTGNLEAMKGMFATGHGIITRLLAEPDPSERVRELEQSLGRAHNALAAEVEVGTNQRQEMKERIRELEGEVHGLRTQNANLGETLKIPRAQDVADIHRLTERIRELEANQKTEAERVACDTLEGVWSWQSAVKASKALRAERNPPNPRTLADVIKDLRERTGWDGCGESCSELLDELQTLFDDSAKLKARGKRLSDHFDERAKLKAEGK